MDQTSAKLIAAAYVGGAVSDCDPLPRRDLPLGRSIGAFLEYRIDRAVPGAMELLEQILGRRAATRHNILQRFEILRFVAPVPVQPFAPGETGPREAETFLGEIEHAAVAEHRAEAELRNIVAQLLTLSGGPVLDDAPGRLE